MLLQSAILKSDYALKGVAHPNFSISSESFRLKKIYNAIEITQEGNIGLGPQQQHQQEFAVYRSK